MASQLRNGLLERVAKAETLLANLRSTLLQIKQAAAAKLCQDEVSRLSVENGKLKSEVNQLVAKLRRTEELNGVVQVQSTAAPSVPNNPSNNGKSPSSAAPANPAGNSATKDKPQPAKSEKKAKTKKAPKEAAEPTDAAPVDISRLLLKVGKITAVKKHPDADSLYIEIVDLAEASPRTIISGLVKHVPIEQMQDRLAVFACNLKPAKMRGILSEGMIMCASTPEKVQIIDVPAGAIPGDLVTFPGYSGEADKQLNPKKKIWEALVPDLKTDDNGVATYRGSPFTISNKGICQAPGCANFPIK